MAWHVTLQITGAAPAEETPAEATGATSREGGDQKADEAGVRDNAEASPETETAVAGGEREGGAVGGQQCRRKCVGYVSRR